MLLRCITLFFLTISIASAQVSLQGTVKNQKGEPLPFTAIAVSGSTQGTIANEEGNYRLELPPGYYEVIFQHLGYQSGMKSITLEKENITFDAILAEQSFRLSEVTIGKGSEDHAYSIMRRAIAKSTYHQKQVDSYKAKVYTKASIVITDLPLEFMYRSKLKEIEKTENFKKGVPILNETVSEVEFKQPNTYHQRVLAARNSQDNDFPNPNEYILSSFYKPEIVKTVSPLSPKAFSYYKFEYVGTFRENGVDVSKIKVIPRSYGDGVFKGTIHIVENSWAIHSLELQTVKMGVNLSIKQIYNSIKGVWLPINQQFNADGGFYGLKGKADYVVSQTFLDVKVNPAFVGEIEIVDGKVEDTPRLKSNLKTADIEALLSQNKPVSAKNMRKLMKTYQKQERENAKETGADFDFQNDRKSTTVIDSLANNRGLTYWDSLRTVPLTKSESASFDRLDSLNKRNITKVRHSKNTKTGSDTVQVTRATNVKKKSKGPISSLLIGRTFRLDSAGQWRIIYKSPLLGPEVNTVEGIIFNNGGLTLSHTNKLKDKFQISGITRYSLGRNKLLAYGSAFYQTKSHAVLAKGGRMMQQFHPNNAIHPFLNSITTLFFEQNFSKLYQNDFLEVGYQYTQPKSHLTWKIKAGYSDRTTLDNLENADKYRLIRWSNRTYTSNTPANQFLASDSITSEFALRNNRASYLQTTFQWKPWQTYRIRKGTKVYLDDETPELSLYYKKGIPDLAGSHANFDHLQIAIRHGFATGVKNKLTYYIAAGSFLNREKVAFQDFHHFNGNQFFLMLGDPVRSFRLLNYYQYSTDKNYIEAHLQGDFRKLVFTQLELLRRYGVKESIGFHHLSTAYTNGSYSELSYGFDVGIRFPFRIEVISNFEQFKYKSTGFRIGLTMNLPF